MRSGQADSLRALFEKTLLPALAPLEDERKRVSQRVMLMAAAVGGVTVLLEGLMSTFHADLNVLGSIAAVGLGVAAACYHWMTRDFVRAYKTQVLAKVIAFVGPGMTYQPSGLVPREAFVRSHTFDRTPDRYSGDDLVQGRLGDTELSFSEIHAEYRTERTNNKGERKTTWHTIFKGLFFDVDFNKDFKGSVLVVPDRAERALGAVGAWFQNTASGGRLVKLEDPEFEALFAVYCDDQTMARYVLSTSVMQRLVAFRQKVGKEIRLSFSQGRMYLAIPFAENLFEPNLFRSVIDFPAIESYHALIQLAFGVVEDFNLNTRIWSKQGGVPTE